MDEVALVLSKDDKIGLELRKQPHHPNASPLQRALRHQPHHERLGGDLGVGVADDVALGLEYSVHGG